MSKPKLYMISTGDGGGVKSRMDNDETSITIRSVDENGQRKILATVDVFRDDAGQEHIVVRSRTRNLHTEFLGLGEDQED